jgi:hypothetical protein
VFPAFIGVGSVIVSPDSAVTGLVAGVILSKSANVTLYIVGGTIIGVHPAVSVTFFDTVYGLFTCVLPSNQPTKVFPAFIGVGSVIVSPDSAITGLVAGVMLSKSAKLTEYVLGGSIIGVHLAVNNTSFVTKYGLTTIVLPSNQPTKVLPAFIGVGSVIESPLLAMRGLVFGESVSKS